MTRQEAQRILLKAFVATGELPKNIEALLKLIIQVTAPEGDAGAAKKRCEIDSAEEASS
jgi:hypothetical protein